MFKNDISYFFQYHFKQLIEFKIHCFFHYRHFEQNPLNLISSRTNGEFYINNLKSRFFAVKFWIGGSYGYQKSVISVIFYFIPF